MLRFLAGLALLPFAICGLAIALALLLGALDALLR